MEGVVRLRARHRRRVHLAVALLWAGPGAIASVVYAHSLAWIVGMSWFACVYAAVSAWAAATPVEDEGQAQHWDLRIAGGWEARRLLEDGWEPVGSYRNPAPASTTGGVPTEPILTTFRRAIPAGGIDA